MSIHLGGLGFVAGLLGLGMVMTYIGPAAGVSAGAEPSNSTVGPRADFNGDGFGDLAVGVPGEDIGAISNAGGVNVIYGTSTGLRSADNQFWSQNTAGIRGIAEVNDGFGRAVAVGDFNRDGFSDLAIGVPFDSVGSVAQAGAVNVLYGSATGLTSVGNQVWDQNSSGVKHAAGVSAEFGFDLAARDFNGDGFSDLAIGIPGENHHGFADVGAVSVLYGSGSGLSSSGDQHISGKVVGRFGTALAAGNFDATGAQDLAVGAPLGSNGVGSEGGDVYWLTGGVHGLKGGLRFVPNSHSTAGAHCGSALASLNWNDDSTGFADLAVGCPNASPNHTDEGVVQIHQGSATGLGDFVNGYSSPDAQAGAEFGTSLAAADFGSDGSGGHDDLVVGAPLYDVGSLADAGEATVLYLQGGSAAFQTVRQGAQGTIGKAEAGDLFGEAVTTGNFDGDGWGDLAVGVPGERLGSSGGAGGINVLYGSSIGIASAGNQFWSQDSPGIFGIAEAEDFFGDALAGRNG